jgi:hypothetical protein
MSDFDPDAYLQESTPTQAFNPDEFLSQQEHSKAASYDVLPGGKRVLVGSPEDIASRSPTEGMSGYQKFMAGAGKAQADMARGIGQLVGVTPQSDVDEAATRDKPLMQTGAGVAGDIAGNVADVAIPGGLAGDALKGLGMARTGAVVGGIANPTTFGGAAASGALQGALQPVTTGQSRTQNALVGAGSGAVGQGLARGGSAILSAMAPEEAAGKAVKALTEAGVPLDAAQRTGSTLLNRAKIMLSDNPLTAGAQADFADMQQKAVNRAFLSTIGETANAATPEVMSRAMGRMSNTYDDVASRVSIPYDKIETPLADIMNNARLTLNDSQFGTISRNADDILQKASQNNGVISGPQFQNIKKTLDSLSSGGDSDVASVARDMRQSLHDGLYQSAVDSGNTADAQLLKQTNQQWRNMRTIEGAIDKQGNGDISPSRLANIMGQKANRNVSIYGKGDTTLSDLAQSANALLPQKVPNSGTPARVIAQVALPMAAGATYEGVREGNWEGAAKGAVGGIALPYLIQKGLNSQGALGRLTSGAGNLAKPSSMPALVGAAVQHAPLSSILAEKNRDTANQTPGTTP